MIEELNRDLSLRDERGKRLISRGGDSTDLMREEASLMAS